MRRYSYYHVNPSYSTLERRGDDNKHNSIWHTTAIVLAIVGIVIILGLIYRKVSDLLHKRKSRAQGQGTFLRSGSLRKNQNQSHSIDQVEYGTHSPYDNENKTESVYSTYANMPAQPASAYRSSSRYEVADVNGIAEDDYGKRF